MQLVLHIFIECLLQGSAGSSTVKLLKVVVCAEDVIQD
jgi:hypothetical protein